LRINTVIDNTPRTYSTPSTRLVRLCIIVADEARVAPRVFTVFHVLIPAEPAHYAVVPVLAEITTLVITLDGVLRQSWAQRPSVAHATPTTLKLRPIHRNDLIQVGRGVAAQGVSNSTVTMEHGGQCWCSDGAQGKRLHEARVRSEPIKRCLFTSSLFGVTIQCAVPMRKGY
jgi:hypothetical protein